MLVAAGRSSLYLRALLGTTSCGCSSPSEHCAPPWNFGGDPVSTSRRSHRQCARGIRQFRRFHARELFGEESADGFRSIPAIALVPTYHAMGHILALAIISAVAQLFSRLAGTLDFELGAHLSPHSADDMWVSDQNHDAAPAVNPRYRGAATPLHGLLRLRNPTWTGPQSFPCLWPCGVHPHEDVRNGQRSTSGHGGRPTDAGMVADNTRFGDMRHDGLSICPQKPAAFWGSEWLSVVSTRQIWRSRMAWKCPDGESTRS